MVVAHNLQAANSNRQFGIVTGEKQKSTEKLSSGYRINRSADDAAGLSISEKMRWQVRGLNKASKNIEDGISLIQVAEGALNETHSVLQRARELAVQAANDTNTDTDRAAIQAEIDVIVGEVDRIATQTNFNSEIYPLNQRGQVSYNSSGGGNTSKIVASIEEIKSETDIEIVNNVKQLLGVDKLEENVIQMNTSRGVGGYYNGDFIKSGNSFLVHGLTYVDNSNTDGSKVFVYEGGVDITYYQGKTSEFGDLNKCGDVYLSDLCTDSEGYIYYRDDVENENMYLIITHPNTDYVGFDMLRASEKDDLISSLSGTSWEGKYEILKSNVYNYTAPSVTRSSNYVITYSDGSTESIDSSDNLLFKYEQKGLWIQSGALAHQGIKINLVDATSSGIGLTGINVSSFQSAGKAISMLDKAIDKVSTYRSTFGAQQNRLEHAMAVDDNTAENTVAAESRIRDTDMAKEMVVYSKQNILQQAGQSMIAQANQSQQGVVSILG